jgi:hypothetical protein
MFFGLGNEALSLNFKARRVVSPLPLFHRSFLECGTYALKSTLMRQCDITS